MNQRLEYLTKLIPIVGHLREGYYARATFFAFALLLHVGIGIGGLYQSKLLWLSSSSGKFIASSLILYATVIGITVWGVLDMRLILKRKASDENRPRGQNYFDIVKRKFLRDKKGLVGAFILFVIVYAAIYAPFFSPYNPLKMDLLNTLESPSLHHPFGTDNFGRDILARVIYGSRVALGIGAGAMLVNMTWGGFLGLLGGYYRGLIDSIIMRVLEITNVIPYLVLVILVLALFRTSGVVPLILILGIFGLYPARIIRSEVLSVREEDYVLASRSIGASDSRIIFHHVLPNSMASLLVTSTMRIGTNIITVAGLSFLGFGVTPPTPSWGRSLQQAQDYMRVATWMAIFPGLAIILTVFAFNILGDSLRDVLDPKLKEYR